MYRLLYLILFVQVTWANPNEMLSDKALEKKFVSIIKENEIEDLIKRTKDFDECRDQNKFDPNDQPAQREAKAQKAQECFQTKISSKSTKDIQKLADNLGLESYQLVKSKNIKDITSYLGTRMRKALTGVDAEDEKMKIKIANMKFKDKQLVNQEDFFRLYSYQLTKNALLEISRFCFENLTNTTSPNPNMNSFYDHWSLFFNSPNATLTVEDTGKHKWGSLTADADPANAYSQIFSGIGQVNPEKLGDFWNFCTERMKAMCDSYQPDSGSSIGANSCLTMNRIRNIRNAISSTEKTIDYMNKNMGTKGSVAVGLDHGQQAKFFRAEKENSYDNLTNFSSHDLLTGNSKQSFNELVEECQVSPEVPDCDRFIAEGSTSPDELIHKIDQEMRLKEEAEIARLLKIKEDNEASFQEYLEKNGYFELAQKGSVSEQEIKDYLKRNYDAQRKSVTEQLKQTVGSRQVMSDATQQDRETAIKASAQETAQERARLSQVILFNNIITANLKLLDSNNKEIGRNVGAWKTESEALVKANIDQSLYQNIQGVIDTSSSATQNSSITGTTYLDMIIGKKDSKETSPK